MKASDNPYIQRNVYEDEQASVKTMAERTRRFEKLCHDVFIATEDGKELYAMLKDQFLLSAGFKVSDPNAANLAIYWEGMREMVRGLGLSAVQHQLRLANVQ